MAHKLRVTTAKLSAAISIQLDALFILCVCCVYDVSAAAKIYILQIIIFIARRAVGLV